MNSPPDDLKALLGPSDKKVIDAAELIAALEAYRKQLLGKGHAFKAEGIAHAIKLVKRMAK